MSDQVTPREMIRMLLRGERLPRPLLLPIVFSLGARLENLPLRAFLSNPTRIANSQRQIRSVLGLDGVTCYFDPYLEAEALGSELEWTADGSSRKLRQQQTDLSGLQAPSSSGSGIGTEGRIPLACDILRRLKTMLPGEPALMAAVTGPFALAEMLMGKVSDESVEFTAESTAEVSKNFLEAGANVIFVREFTSVITNHQRWAELLSPIVNVIRFYEALPILLCGSLSASATSVLNASCDGLICPATINHVSTDSASQAAYLPAAYLSALETGTSFDEAPRAVSTFSVLTTPDDLPANVDAKHLASTFGALRSASRVA